MTRQPTPTNGPTRPRDASSPRSRRGAAPPELPADRAFVVQFQAQRPGGSPRATGRVEHIVSGQARRFDSWEQLRAFVDGTLQNGGSR